MENRLSVELGLRCPVRSLKPYTATVTAGPAGAGILPKLLLMVFETVASSLIFVLPNGRTVEQPTIDTTASVIKDNLTAIRIVGALNYMIRSGKIERAVAESMWKTIIGRNVKILGAQLGAIIGATFGHELITRYQSEKFFNELSQHKFDELSDNSNLIFNLKELPIEFQLVGLNGYIINNLKR